jgi:hypothetical protein
MRSSNPNSDPNSPPRPEYDWWYWESIYGPQPGDHGNLKHHSGYLWGLPVLGITGGHPHRVRPHQRPLRLVIMLGIALASAGGLVLLAATWL